MTKRKVIGAAILLGLAAVQIRAQFGAVVFDPTQNSNALRQIANDIQKLQRLDAQILQLTAQYNQMITNARYFPQAMKSGWVGFGNRIVTNWTVPNTYGATASWNPAVLLGTRPDQAWRDATIAMARNPFLAGLPIGRDNRMMAYSASVNTFDGAGPTALQTIGNNRRQQTQMDLSISRLQSAVADDSPSMNSEVQQLNLLTAGAVQNLQMQQAANNALTSLLEQQSIANKIQRDALADHMNFLGKIDQYAASEPVAWGHAAETLSTWRLK